MSGEFIFKSLVFINRNRINDKVIEIIIDALSEKVTPIFHEIINEAKMINKNINEDSAENYLGKILFNELDEEFLEDLQSENGKNKILKDLIHHFE